MSRRDSGRAFYVEKGCFLATREKKSRQEAKIIGFPLPPASITLLSRYTAPFPPSRKLSNNLISNAPYIPTHPKTLYIYHGMPIVEDQYSLYQSPHFTSSCTQ